MSDNIFDRIDRRTRILREQDEAEKRKKNPHTVESFEKGQHTQPGDAVPAEPNSPLPTITFSHRAVDQIYADVKAGGFSVFDVLDAIDREFMRIYASHDCEGAPDTNQKRIPIAILNPNNNASFKAANQRRQNYIDCLGAIAGIGQKKKT